MAKRLIFSTLLLTPFLFNSSSAQELLVNEVSQGPSGAKEYVEFIVYGINTGCTNGTSDLRGVVMDDNNGTFQPGSGSGIAQGALRIANVPFWAAIPYGTIIVIYNENDRNANLPPDDASMADGNNRLILPADSPLIEGTAVSPQSPSNSNYPAAASNWTTGGGTWSMVGMANGGDSFQTRTSVSASAPYSSVSWGTNSSNTQTYFSGSASNRVFYMSGFGTWNSGTSPVNETPGAANDSGNAAFISVLSTPSSGSLQVNVTAMPSACGASCTGQVNASVNGGTAPYTYSWTGTASTSSSASALCPGDYTVTVTDAGGCQQSSSAQVTLSSTLSVTLNATAEVCAGNCDGQISSSVTGGTAPYTYSWAGNGAATASISNLCSGPYSVTVTDANGCQQNATTTVNPGTPVSNATINAAGPYSDSDSPVQLIAAQNGGTWSSDCGSCTSSSGVFSPAAAGVGTWQICYSVGSGACADNDCISITVLQGCVPQTTTDTINVCPGTAVFIHDGFQLQPGLYTQTFTDVTGCDSTSRVFLMNYEVPEENSTLELCFHDTAIVFGNPVTVPGIYSESRISADGCPYFANTTVVSVDCDFTDPTVYIPNVFTPNGDGFNDTFEIIYTEAFLDEGTIFNRWGNVVLEFSDEMNFWNGKDHNTGSELPDGVYTYIVTITGKDNSRKQYQGFVTLIR